MFLFRTRQGNKRGEPNRQEGKRASQPSEAFGYEDKRSGRILMCRNCRIIPNEDTRGDLAVRETHRLRLGYITGSEESCAENGAAPPGRNGRRHGGGLVW